MKEIRILCGVRTSEYGRRADFYSIFDLIDKPSGSIISRANGQSPAAGGNLLIKIAQEKECTHIFFVDDDVHVPADGLMKLLAHDVDIVSGLYLMRNYPHKPIIFAEANELGHCLHHWLSPNESGLVPVVASGLGCCLIKMSVFDKLEKPYIRLGELDPENWCDDIGFFGRTRAAGIQAYADLSVTCGHVASFVVAPVYHEGQWYSTYDTSGDRTITVPQIYPGMLYQEQEEMVKK